MPTSFNLPAIEPSFGSRGEVTFSVLEAPFGDGYSQREADGLNARKGTYAVRWDNLLDTDAETLKTFFDARAGVEAFNWTPPGELTSRQWRVLSYTAEPSGYLRQTVAATFQEEFDP